MKQYEAVAKVLEEHGGYGTFGLLYTEVLKEPGCNWGTKTPFASIRRIVQTKPDMFFKIKPGLWGLTSQKTEILTTLKVDSNAQPNTVDAFGHSYYQGLITELGNVKGYNTFVPNQDQGRKFLQSTLGEIATIIRLPEFSYPRLLQRAKMVDVLWFNERQMPIKFFEVEHSTDIYNSLLKFLEFQDFRANFFIVADVVRKNEFQSKLTSSAFGPIKEFVKFLDYESLSSLHSKATEVAILQQNVGL